MRKLAFILGLGFLLAAAFYYVVPATVRIFKGLTEISKATKSAEQSEQSGR